MTVITILQMPAGFLHCDILPFHLSAAACTEPARSIKGYRYLRTRYEKGEIVFELEPEKEPEVPAGQKLRRHGYRWRTVRSVSIGLKPVILKVKVPRWLNTTTGEEFEQNPPLSKPTRKSRVRSGD